MRWFSKKAMFTDGEVDLVLSNEDVSDAVCGIVDGFTFYMYKARTRHYMGYVSLRLGESPGLYYLGHIGYRVEPEYRGQHLAERSCRMIVPLMKRLGIHSAVITTNVDNMPSRKTAERLGCILESIVPVPERFRGICAGAAWKCRYIWRV
ncbi:MAG: GNAT family N-acetyltransferase [Clostridia bacterium]|nr:GNAT family N-acetyltransferase [Clostridia bacterium]